MSKYEIVLYGCGYMLPIIWIHSKLRLRCTQGLRSASGSMLPRTYRCIGRKFTNAFGAIFDRSRRLNILEIGALITSIIL